jgi:hypothetical protein
LARRIYGDAARDVKRCARGRNEGGEMPKDRAEVQDQYKIGGGQLNEYEFNQGKGEMEEQEHQTPEGGHVEGLRGADEPNAPQNVAERIREVEQRAHEIVERRRAKAPGGAGGAAAKSTKSAGKAAKSGAKSAGKAAKKSAKKSSKKSAKKSSKKTAKKAAASKGSKAGAGKKGASKSASKKSGGVKKAGTKKGGASKKGAAKRGVSKKGASKKSGRR